MSKHRAAPRRRGRRRTAGGFAVLAVLLTGTAVVVPLVPMARDGDPVESTERVAVALDATSPTVSPTPRTNGPNGEVAAAEARVPRPSGPPASSVSIPERGPGRFDVAAAPSSPIENATTYRVEVEEGLPYATDEVARFIQTTLADKRGWAVKHRLVRVDGDADLRIVLATPETTDALCAPLDTDGRLSCRNGSDVVLNAWRWQFGAEGYADNLTDYRRYVVNHETGHALGYPHVECPGDAAPAPVMLQQTKGLDGCAANPWPARADLAGH